MITIEQRYGCLCECMADWLQQHSLRIVSGPTEEQITLAQAQAHLRLDLYGSPGSHPDDDLIEDVYIPAAREICESISGRALAPKVYELGLSAFPQSPGFYSMRQGINLRVGPVAGVASVTYVDGDGVDIVLTDADFTADVYTEPGWVYPLYGGSWPGTRNISNSVRVRFNAGYDGPLGSPQDRPLPAKYRAAMLLALGHLYENREQTTTLKLDEIPMGVYSLLLPDSLRIGFA